MVWDLLLSWHSVLLSKSDLQDEPACVRTCLQSETHDCALLGFRLTIQQKLGVWATYLAAIHCINCHAVIVSFEAMARYLQLS